MILKAGNIKSHEFDDKILKRFHDSEVGDFRFFGIAHCNQIAKEFSRVLKIVVDDGIHEAKDLLIKHHQK